jgi:hypothetical protein
MSPSRKEIQFDSALFEGCELFVTMTIDGVIDPPCSEILQNEYSGQYQILAPSNIPTVDQLKGVTVCAVAETGKIERSYQALRKFMGIEVWPSILMIANIESLSDDQALALRCCLKEKEFDKATDWPRSIGFILSKGASLHPNLHKFVRSVMDVDKKPTAEDGRHASIP